MTATQSTNRTESARVWAIGACLVVASVCQLWGYRDAAWAAVIVALSVLAGSIAAVWASRRSQVGGLAAIVVRMLVGATCYLVVADWGVIDSDDVFAASLVAFYVLAAWGETWLTLRSMSRAVGNVVPLGTSAQSHI